MKIIKKAYFYSQKSAEKKTLKIIRNEQVNETNKNEQN